jgi:hypothetical protein
VIFRWTRYQGKLRNIPLRSLAVAWWPPLSNPIRPKQLRSRPRHWHIMASYTRKREVLDCPLRLEGHRVSREPPQICCSGRILPVSKLPDPRFRRVLDPGGHSSSHGHWLCLSQPERCVPAPRTQVMALSLPLSTYHRAPTFFVDPKLGVQINLQQLRKVTYLASTILGLKVVPTVSLQSFTNKPLPHFLPPIDNLTSWSFQSNLNLSRYHPISLIL